MKPVPITFESENSALKGWFFPARGKGPFPTAVLLHGFPGNNRDVLGLGDALMRAGINAAAFNYRGTWGSQGLYTAGNSLQDIYAMLDFIQSKKTAKKYAVDIKKIGTIGYSFGGGMAVLGALADQHVGKVACIAGADLGVFARLMKADEQFRTQLEAGLAKDLSDSGTRSPGAQACLDKVTEKAEQLDLVGYARELASKDVYLIGGWQDRDSVVETYSLPLYRALQANGAEHLRIKIYNDDHNLARVKKSLQQRIATWMKHWV
jgi:dienelactone hydrolase